jgi:hypothetical protein
VTTPENMISQLSELCRKQGASEDDIAGFYLCDDLEESLGVAYAILIDHGAGEKAAGRCRQEASGPNAGNRGSDLRAKLSSTRSSVHDRDPARGAGLSRASLLHRRTSPKACRPEG